MVIFLVHRAAAQSKGGMGEGPRGRHTTLTRCAPSTAGGSNLVYPSISATPRAPAAPTHGAPKARGHRHMLSSCSSAAQSPGSLRGPLIDCDPHARFVALQKRRMYDAAVQALVDAIKATIPMEMKLLMRRADREFVTAGLAYIAHNELLCGASALAVSAGGAVGGGCGGPGAARPGSSSGETRKVLYQIMEGRRDAREAAAAHELQQRHQGNLTLDSIGSRVTLEELAMQQTDPNFSLEKHAGTDAGAGASQTQQPQSVVLEALQHGMFDKITRRLVTREEKERGAIMLVVEMTQRALVHSQLEHLRHIIHTMEKREWRKLLGNAAGDILASASATQDQRRRCALDAAASATATLCEALRVSTDQFNRSESKKAASRVRRVDDLFDECEQQLVGVVRAGASADNAPHLAKLRAAHREGQVRWFETFV